MRELKFRVWDKSVEHLYEVQTLIDGGGVIGRYVLNGEMNYIQLCADDVIIEQYTGLKDKNGKPIYEGDIVKLGEDSYEVLFDSYGQFCIENKKLHWTKDCFSFNSVDVWNSKRDGLLVEVVGNIHENPELLEEEG